MSLLLLFKGGSTAAGFRSLALELGIGASPGLSLDAGSFTVSGQDAALKRGLRLQADAGSYTLDGVAAQRDLTMVGAAGSYSLSGQAATFSYAQNAGFRSLALEIGAGAVTSATVTAEPGTYSVSGQDAGLRRGLRLVAEAGSYTYTGVAAQRDVVVTAAAGTYSVTGYDATLTTATSVSGGFFSLLLEIGGGALPSARPLVGGSPKRRRYRLSIDGEEFDVRSPEEAQALLEQARQLAQERAETALQRANKAKGRRKTEILKDARKALPEPRIEVDDQALQAMVQTMVGEISALYRSTLQAIEISALLRRVEQDEEDALLALLL
jgi:hypothetical protein